MTDIDIESDVQEDEAAASSSTDREIVLTRVLDAPRALVWKAWTQPEHIARWWGPHGFAVSGCTVDFKVGGGFRLLMQGADGANHPCRGVFREIVPLQRIVYDGEADDRHGCGAGLPPGARVTVTFEDEGNKTRLTLHTRFVTAAARIAAYDAGYTAGWGEGLERLADYARRMDHQRPRSMDDGIGNPASTAGDEAELRARAAAWSKALEAKDIDGLTARYAKDVVLFDVKPPFRIEGVEAIRRVWEACLPYLPARFASERRDFRVTVSGDVAFAHGLHRIRPIGEDHPCGGTWVRVTICYRRIEGDWRVVHEHASVPFDPETGSVSFITEMD